MDVNYKTWIYCKLSAHLNIKYHMDVNVLTSRSNFPCSNPVRWNTINFILFNMYILHLFYNILGLESSPHFPVNITWKIWITNLCEVHHYFDFTFNTIIYHVHSVSLIDPFKSGLSLISFVTVHSTNLEGLYCFISLKGKHLTELSIHFTNNLQLQVVYLRWRLRFVYLINAFTLLIAVFHSCYLLFQWGFGNDGLQSQLVRAWCHTWC